MGKRKNVSNAQKKRNKKNNAAAAKKTKNNTPTKGSQDVRDFIKNHKKKSTNAAPDFTEPESKEEIAPKTNEQLEEKKDETISTTAQTPEQSDAGKASAALTPNQPANAKDYWNPNEKIPWARGSWKAGYCHVTKGNFGFITTHTGANDFHYKTRDIKSTNGRDMNMLSPVIFLPVATPDHLKDSATCIYRTSKLPDSVELNGEVYLIGRFLKNHRNEGPKAIMLGFPRGTHVNADNWTDLGLEDNKLYKFIVEEDEDGNNYIRESIGECAEGEETIPRKDKPGFNSSQYSVSENLRKLLTGDKDGFELFAREDSKSLLYFTKKHWDSIVARKKIKSLAVWSQFLAISLDEIIQECTTSILSQLELSCAQAKYERKEKHLRARMDKICRFKEGQHRLVSGLTLLTG
jgi:hypothetical protein